MKPSALRRLLQAAAFTRKEAVDILRQPRLLLTLVLGPFLIMAVFGLLLTIFSMRYAQWYWVS